MYCSRFFFAADQMIDVGSSSESYISVGSNLIYLFGGSDLLEDMVRNIFSGFPRFFVYFFTFFVSYKTISLHRSKYSKDQLQKCYLFDSNNFL